jgi:uncharacterized protein DUF6600
MKRSLLLLCATLLAVAAPLPPAHADDSVPVDFFYDALSPYGDWIYAQNYGYVWQPLVAQQNNWAPYSDGYWAYTDAGWTWVSNEDFGWITYHYGRWIRMANNWVWVPGYDWAPAWVSWRQTQGQIGWAPLPPEAAWAPNIGFGGWTDSYYDVGPASYNFVPMNAFASGSSLRPFIMDRSRNFAFYDQSVNITHTNYQQNVLHNIFVGGPDPARIDGLGSNHVRRLTLRRDDENFHREWLNHNNGKSRGGMGNLSRVEHDQFVVAAPSIRRGPSQSLPSRVREHFNQPEIDHGWRGAGVGEADRLRQHQRDELARTRPPTLPEKNAQPATSTLPPPAFGRVLNADERAGSGQPHDPRRTAEEVRRPAPIPGNGRPGGVNEQQPGNRGNTPRADEPQGEHRPGGLPGMKPGERAGDPPGVPPTKTRTEPQPPTAPPSRREPQAPVVPPQARPNLPGNREQRPGRSRAEPQQPNVPPQTKPNFPGNREQRPGRSRAEPQQPNIPQPVPPSTPPPSPRVRPAPTPQPQQPPQQPPRQPPQQPPQQPQVRPMPAPHVNAPRVAPTPPPAQPPATPAAPQGQNPGPQGPGGRHGKKR